MGNASYQPGDGFAARKISGESVLVPVGKDSFNGMITFNETGNYIWQKLHEGCSEEETREALCEDFEVTKEQAGQDVKRFIEFCLHAGMLKSCRTDEQERPLGEDR